MNRYNVCTRNGCKGRKQNQAAQNRVNKRDDQDIPLVLCSCKKKKKKSNLLMFSLPACCKVVLHPLPPTQNKFHALI